MDEEGASGLCLQLVEAEGDRLYPMYFGIACALFAFKDLSEKGLIDERWFDIREKMLQGSCHLLGLLVWRVQTQEVNASEKWELLKKLKRAETEIQELKSRRIEDGRANEKVVSIFAAQEQRWFDERKSLRQHIGALINDLRIFERRKHDEICELNKKLQDMEKVVKTKNSVLEEEGRKKKDLEKRLESLETLVQELKESAKQEAQTHVSELWKHKSAFIELVSNQRQLEAELGRAHRRAETVKQQLEFVFQEKEESVFMLQKLSMELENVRNDSEQKDKILSAMLRKSKLDTDEKQGLLKEINLSKAWIKQAETEKWRIDSKSKCERHTLRSMLRKQVGSRLGAKNTKSDPKDHARHLIDLETESAFHSPHSDDEDVPDKNQELEKQLDSWVCLQAGKYRMSIEQRHQLEVEAFSEQIRLKDQKLEAYHWRSVSMEVESKGLTSQIEGLNQSISQLSNNKLKLETLLVEREAELKSLKDQIAVHLNSLNRHRNKFNSLDDDKTPDTEGSKELTEEKSVESKNESLMKERALWKMDIHALGVSYKIKRLKQQLLMLERLTGKHGDREDEEEMRIKDFLLLLSLLNKQVTRYHSLQDKADDLCKRMRDKDLGANGGDPNSVRTKEDSRTLEHFLEETFQLQRFIVATGQKLIEIQSKIASGFIAMAEKLEGSTSIDMRRFSDNVQGLFREVQRGLEVRIARIIGDLEGTLACDGIRSIRQ